jgi:hypothetical protein
MVALFNVAKCPLGYVYGAKCLLTKRTLTKCLLAK